MNKKPYIIDGQRVSKDDYNRERFDRFLLTVAKGRKQEIQAYAASLGMSLNAYIVSLIDKDMEREQK